MSDVVNVKDQVRLRPATDTDVPFIFNSWLKCYRHSPNTKGCENPVYFAQHHKVLEGLCKRAAITIACNQNDISQIYGYICNERIENILCIHFLYVKEIYRKFGIAKILAESAGFKADTPSFYTHRTFVSESLEKKFERLLIYNPYLAYYAYKVADE